MKFFVASPWRNMGAVQALEAALLSRGHAPWSFLDNGANVATGQSVMGALTNWEDDPMIERIFNSEMRKLKDCDALILLEPAGHSSLAEAGIAYGMAKQVILIGPVERPEVVYLICSSHYLNVETFLAHLDGPAA